MSDQSSSRDKNQSPDKNQDQQDAQEWVRHEHVADPVNKEALRLVKMAGTPELAKQAIDALQETIPADREGLAREIGFPNVTAMMEHTEILPLPSGSFTHLTKVPEGGVVAWGEKSQDVVKRFESRQQAIAALQEEAESSAHES